VNRKTEHRYRDIASIIPLLLFCPAFIGVNVFLGAAAPAFIAYAAAGSFFYVLFGLMAYCDDSRLLDPIQSGRTGALTILIVFAAVFTGGHPAAAAAITLAGAVAMEFYAHRLIGATGREMAAGGGFINLTLGLVFLVYWIKDPASWADRLNGALTAVLPASFPHPAAAAVLAATGAALLLLLVRSLPELGCLSLGEAYFSRSGRSHRFWYGLVLALRGLFMALTFLSLGWLHGALLTLPGRAGIPRYVAVFRALLLCVCYTQGLVLLAGRLGMPAAVMTAFAVSMGSLIARYGKKGMRYGYR